MKVTTKTVRECWEALGDEEFFFVPSVDAENDEKKVRRLGYIPRGNAPETHIGVYRGMWGIFCCWSMRPRRRKKMLPNLI
jgi:hypothetical protein